MWGTDHTEASLPVKEMQSVVTSHAGAGTNEEQNNWNPYTQGNWKHWGWMAETITLGVAESITCSPTTSCADFWLPGQILRDRGDLIVKKKWKLKPRSRGEKKCTRIHLSNGLHSFSFPRTSIIDKRFVYFGSKLTQVRFPNLGPFLFAISVYWQNFPPCEIILE